MQRVQTCMRLTAEPTITRTFWRFGIQRRLDTLWAWLTRLPNTGALPQTSHILAISRLLVQFAADGWRFVRADEPGREGRTASCLLQVTHAILVWQIAAKGVDCRLWPILAQASQRA